MTPEQIEIESKKFEEFMRDKHSYMCLDKTPDGSIYIDRNVYYLRQGWLACCQSRDILCVTLPKPSTMYDHFDDPTKYWAKKEIIATLQSAGINYRVEE
jgi:hypothetical protein